MKIFWMLLGILCLIISIVNILDRQIDWAGFFLAGSCFSYIFGNEKEKI